jgi:2-dehydro-3-deoxyphosphogluconate aldolase/(4S)-4-hydroxy-2-oxoglutarate aldolase
MMDALRTILDTGIVAIIRSDSPAGLGQTVRALAAGGVRAIEVTMTTPGALAAIADVAGQGGQEYVIGAGSVLDAESARAAILAGAEFLVAPVTDLNTIRLAKRYGKVVCPGAFTPTEVLAAWAGPAYIKALAGPLPQVRYMPVGGVDLTNARDFIRAGACALGIGGSLVSSKLIAAGQWGRITDTARQYVAAVAEART